VLTVQSARQLVLRHCRTIGARLPATETIPLLESYGRVIAEAIRLDCDQPQFPRSMRDGFALRAEDTRNVPVTLKCVGEVRAGQLWEQVLRDGEALQIMTGAAVPPGANAVVMVEYTESPARGEVRVLREVRIGENVAPKGSERLAGETVLQPGKRISALELAVLASVGRSQVGVYRAPSVSILATGDEIVDITKQPGPAQIRNSTSFSLYGQVRRIGGLPMLQETAGDNLEELKNGIHSGLESDVLLVSGGVSMGKYDLVETVFSELGIQVHFESVSMRPGKPTVFGTWKDRWIFGLPGNPVSTFVAFELFVRPVLQSLLGLHAETVPLVNGELQSEIVEKSGRTAFLPAKIVSRRRKLEVLPVMNWKGSADIFAAVEANGLVIVPLEVARLQAGEEVEVLLFDELEYAMEGRF
jgi:molybdopterin molybdotransferase